jgi:hypothetical protein
MTVILARCSRCSTRLVGPYVIDGIARLVCPRAHCLGHGYERAAA